MFPLMFPRTHLSRHKPGTRPLHRQPLSYCHKPGTHPLYSPLPYCHKPDARPLYKHSSPPQTGHPSPVQAFLSRHKPDTRPLYKHSSPAIRRAPVLCTGSPSPTATNRTPVPCTSIPLPPYAGHQSSAQAAPLLLPQTGRPSPVQPPPLLPHAAATLCLSSYRQHALLRLPGCLNVGIFLSRTFIRRFYHYFNNYPL